MASIGEHLKQLRKAKGLTQETVAGQVGLTRQAISSYEASRTQPDLEMLKKFAEVYGVSVEDILYGTDRSSKKRRYLRITAAASLATLWLTGLLPSLMMLGSNLWLRIEDGTQLSGEMKAVWEMRVALSQIREAIQGIGMGLFSIGLLLLLIFSLQLDHPVSLRKKLAFLGLMLLGTLLSTVPWALMDPLFHMIDYTLHPMLCIVRAVLFLLLGLLLEHILQKKRQKG